MMIAFPTRPWLSPRRPAAVREPLEPATLPVRIVWLRLGLALAAVTAAYLPVILEMAAEWIEYPYLSHGFAIPVIAGYLVWTRRAHLAAVRSEPTWGGLPLLTAGLALCAAGSLGGETFLSRVSLPVTILGTSALVAGWPVARQLLPATAYLVFMIPLPYVTLKALTERARALDAAVTATVLDWLGIPVFHDGFVLHLPRITLEVADVCSSIPGTLSLLALGGAYGLVTWRPNTVRLALVLAAVPLGIASNIVRIVVTAVAANQLGPVVLNNIVHKSSGTTVFLMTFGALTLLDTALRRGARRP